MNWQKYFGFILGGTLANISYHWYVGNGINHGIEVSIIYCILMYAPFKLGWIK